MRVHDVDSNLLGLDASDFFWDVLVPQATGIVRALDNAGFIKAEIDLHMDRREVRVILRDFSPQYAARFDKLGAIERSGKFPKWEYLVNSKGEIIFR